MEKNKKENKNTIIKIAFVVILLAVIGVIIAILSRGKTISIRLEGNATTGYEWKCTANKEGILKQVGDSYTTDDKNVVGSSGVWTYKFKGLKAGRVVLNCDYQRSFEENSTIKTEIYILEVDKDLSIKELN